MKSTYRVIVVIVTVFTLFSIFIAGFFRISDPDLFWHLKMGEDLLRHGLSPFVDRYSYSFNGAPIHGVAWPFQILVYSFYSLFHGIFGVQILRVLLRLVPLTLFFIFFKKKKISLPVQALCLIYLAIIALYAHEPRPELGTQTFGLICFFLVLNLREKFQYKTALWLSFVLFLFTNYHLSSVFGFAIAGAYLIDLFIRNLHPFAPRPVWIRFFIISILLIIPGFLNHDLAHPLLVQGNLDAWQPYIIEYRTRPFLNQEPFLLIYWFLLVLTFIHSLYRKNYFALVLIAVLSFELLRMPKLFPHFVIFTLPLVALAMEDWLSWLTSKNKNGLRYFVTGFLAMVTITVGAEAFYISVVKPLLPVSISIDTHFFPEEITSYIKRHGLHGNVFNEYGEGGFLLFQLAPDIKIYIDGRTTILYPLEHMIQFSKVEAFPDALKDESRKYGVDYVIGDLFDPDGLFETAINSGQYSIEFIGSFHGLLRKTSGRFERSSFLFVHPECLKVNDLEILRADLSKLHENRPQISPFEIFIENSILFLSQKDHKIFLETPPPSFREDFYSNRLMARMALQYGTPVMRAHFLAKMGKWGRDDLLDLAELDCDLNQCARTEDFLNAIKAPITRQDQYVRAFQLLSRVKRQRGFKIFTPERVERLHSKIPRGGEDSMALAKGPDWCR